MTDQPNLPSETDSFPFCDPYLCDGRDDKIVRTEELEKQLSTLIEGSRIAHIIIELKGRADIEGPLLKCISSIKSPNLKTTKNTATLKKMKAEIKRHLQGFVNRERTSEDTIQIYRFYLATLVKIVVSRKWSFEKIATGWSRSDNSTQNSSGVICLASLQSRNVLDKKGWSNSEVDLFWKEYTPEVISAISLGLESSAILRFIKFVEKETGYPTFESPFWHLLNCWWSTNIKGTTWASYLDADYLKNDADTSKSIKRYDFALESYGVMNLLALDSPYLIQSLANSAALRLRLSSESTQHLPLAVLECTLALQIDPNHVKALFRRGLALALSKKWNEAIINSERAVELDPLSPAKKEFEVARRKVTRSIGD